MPDLFNNGRNERLFETIQRTSLTDQFIPKLGKSNHTRLTNQIPGYIQNVSNYMK